MGVVSMIKTAVGAADNIGDLVGQLYAVRAKGVAASEELARLEQAKLDAESFDEAKSIEERVARVRWECEHLAALLPQLEQRLAIAKNARQKAAIARHAAANRRLWPKLRRAISDAVDAQEELIRMRADATAEIGEHACTLHLPVAAFAGFLHREHFECWTRELDRVMAEPAPVNPVPVAVAKPASTKTAAKPVAPVPPAEPAKPAKLREPRRDKVAINGKLVRILRAGIELPDGTQGYVGDEVALSDAVARELVRNGGGDFVSADAGANVLKGN
jgi:hypothetical protein